MTVIASRASGPALPTSTLVLFGLATGAVSGMFVIHANRYLDLAERIPHVALPMTLAMAAGMPLWLWLMKRRDKHRVWSVGAVGMIVVLISIVAIEPGNWKAMAAAMTGLDFFIGLASIALQAAPRGRAPEAC